MITKSLSLTSALVLFLGLIAPGKAEAVNFKYTKIIDNSSEFSFFGFPTLNDNGTVAFNGRLDTDVTGVYTISNGTVTTIVDDTGPFGGFGAFFGSPTINNNGTVAFFNILDTGLRGIFTGSGGPVTTITFNFPSFRGLDFFPDINDSGTVAFHAEFRPVGTGSALFTNSGGVMTPVITTSAGEPIPVFPAIGDNGTIAFSLLPDGFSQAMGIFTSSGGITTTIADDSGPFSIFDRLSYDINNKNTVAFQANLDDGSSGIFTGSGGAITTITDSNGACDFFGQAAINDQGTVVYECLLDDGRFGLFTGSDPLNGKVIASGDTLLGSQVTAINFYNYKGLNNVGQVVFAAGFEDGTQGIFIAEPVPEPASVFGLSLLGVLGGGSILRDKRKLKTIKSTEKELGKISSTHQ